MNMKTKKRLQKLLFLIPAFAAAACSQQQTTNDSDLKLWYETPADASVADSPDGWQDDEQWLKALPLGNGSLGAMVFGDVAVERIQLNEESMWSGSHQESDNPEAARHLATIRRLLFDGKYKEATELTNRTQVCKGKGSGQGNGATTPFGCFQTLGDLWIDFANKGDYTHYRRELDLSKATATVTYQQGQTHFQRQAFVSAPDQVLVVHMTADTRGQLSFTCRMDRPERYHTHTEDDQLIMSGALDNGQGGDGVRYMARLKALAQGGQVTYSDSTMTVENADEVTLLLTASTNYQLSYPTYQGRDYERLSLEALQRAAKKSFDQLYRAHEQEYCSYSDRAHFRLATGADTLATDVLVAQAKEGHVHPHLYELMFQYGRYLLISSSRPGTLPANLQGIWANKIQTPWNGDYHTDINVEMNYWPAEVTNLSEMHLPMFDLIASLVKPGSVTARTQYGAKGWVVHPITNVWGYTSPGESASWGMHTGAPAWICQHIGEHYRFSGDKEFLQQMYPVLKGAVEFYMDWLVEDPHTGQLVSGPAVSPENNFIAPDGSWSQFSMGPTHDQQVIWQLFDDFLRISSLLHIQDAFTQQVADAQARLTKTKVGSDGRIQEWAQEFPEPEPGHRHISHLFAVHPGAAINLLETPELTEAASRSLDYRIAHGGGHTGWSAAWLVSLYARLQQAGKAQENLDRVLEKSLNYNLFTECPPFQIDANFGTTAGIAEMLLQSHVRTSEGAYVLQLLPALPAAWTDGHIDGFKARGGFVVSVQWQDGQLVKAKVTSLLGHPCKIWYNGSYLHDLHLQPGETWTWDGQ